MERLFFRLMRTTLTSMKKAAAHPLAREVHFHVTLLALRVLAYCTGSTERAKWQLKDEILSAALAWFSHPPQWSYGSNKLQVKAEVHLMNDVLAALQHTANIGAKPTMPLQSLQPKQELLVYLLNSEVVRLGVWINPLGEAGSSGLGINKSIVNDTTISPLLKVAWMESASLAVQIALRSQSRTIQNEVRWQLVNYPEKALDEPEALQLLLGSTLPGDVSSQLKVSIVAVVFLALLVLTAYSISCTGLPSTQSHRRPISYLHTATTRS